MRCNCLQWDALYSAVCVCAREQHRVWKTHYNTSVAISLCVTVYDLIFVTKDTKKFRSTRPRKHFLFIRIHLINTECMWSAWHIEQFTTNKWTCVEWTNELNCIVLWTEKIDNNYTKDTHVHVSIMRQLVDFGFSFVFKNRKWNFRFNFCRCRQNKCCLSLELAIISVDSAHLYRTF